MPMPDAPDKPRARRVEALRIHVSCPDCPNFPQLRCIDGRILESGGPGRVYGCVLCKQTWLFEWPAPPLPRVRLWNKRYVPGRKAKR